jgi:hypothetical protein
MDELYRIDIFRQAEKLLVMHSSQSKMLLARNTFDHSTRVIRFEETIRTRPLYHALIQCLSPSPNDCPVLQDKPHLANMPINIGKCCLIRFAVPAELRHQVFFQ